MDVVVAVLKPKQGHSGQGYKPQLYEILLLDSKTPPGEKVKPAKYLPMFSMKAVEDEPRELVLTQVHRLTGIKGERALPVQWSKDLSQRESLSQFSLFFVPVSPNDKISKKFVDQAQNTPAFYPLEYVIDVVNSGAVNFPSPTRKLLQHLESWLREKHQRSSTVECMFRARAEFRIHLTVHNPVFIPSRLAPDTGLGGSSKQPPFPQEISKMANEVLAKMLSIEKCDAVVINPLFGSGLPYKPKPNIYVINQHWPSVPDWEKLMTKLDKINIPRDNNSISHKRRDKFPLHSCAAGDNKAEVEILLKQGYPHSELDAPMKWAPIHYAAWYGCVSVVETLLSFGCSPNLVEGSTGQTALHIAAKKGNEQMARCLLQCPDIEVNIKDKAGKQAIHICSSVSTKTVGHQQVEMLIREAMERPSYSVEVHLMDNSSKSLKLTAGPKTNVQTLNEQMMKEFNLPPNYSDIFTMWIVSKNLELQLKPDHEVVKELRQWNTRCVNMLTDAKNPSEEEPALTWRRNVKVSVDREKQIQHPKALDLLFHEAYHNYIRGFYPCKDKDIITFATVLFSLQHQEAAVKVKSILSNQIQNQLKDLIPAAVLQQNNWVSKISREYPSYRDISQQQLKAEFLAACRKLMLYGSAFFTGVLKSSSPSVHCHIGVNDVGIHLIHSQTKQLLHSLEYREISWQMIPENTTLEVKIIRPRDGRSQRGSSFKNMLEIRTRAAGLIDHLMQQLNR